MIRSQAASARRMDRWDRAFLHEAGEKRLVFVGQFARRAGDNLLTRPSGLLVEPNHQSAVSDGPCGFSRLFASCVSTGS